MGGDNFADAPAGGSAGFDCAFDRADFAADDTRHQTRVDFFPSIIATRPRHSIIPKASRSIDFLS